MRRSLIFDIMPPSRRTRGPPFMQLLFVISSRVAPRVEAAAARTE